MKIEYTSDLSFYIHDGQLPLAVSFIDGDHPERLFHDHKFVEVVIITRGRLLHIVENECCEAVCGDALVIHPGTVHGYDDSAGAGVLNLIFDGGKLPLPQLDSGEFSLFGKFFPTSGKQYVSAKPVVNLPEDVLRQTIAMILRIDDESKNVRPGSMFYSMALFMETLTLIFRAGGMQTPSERQRFMIGDALRYMNKYFPEPVTLSKLARISCMSERNFQRHFHNALGKSPMEHLLAIRLRHVQEQLITSDAEIGAIALSCGFYDSNYLCKKFKSAFHITPSEFRRMKRKKS